MTLQVIITDLKIKIFLLITLSVLCFYNISAQKDNKKFTITGTVTDASGNPVLNGIVMIDGENTSSLTDSKGTYRIKVRKDA